MPFDAGDPFYSPPARSAHLPRLAWISAGRVSGDISGGGRPLHLNQSAFGGADPTPAYCVAVCGLTSYLALPVPSGEGAARRCRRLIIIRCPFGLPRSGVRLLGVAGRLFAPMATRGLTLLHLSYLLPGPSTRGPPRR